MNSTTGQHELETNKTDLINEGERYRNKTFYFREVIEFSTSYLSNWLTFKKREEINATCLGLECISLN